MAYVKRLLLALRKTIYFRVTLVICVIAAFFGAIRGCSVAEKEAHLTFQVAFDPVWQALPLTGKEKNLTAFIDELFQSLREKSPLNLTLYPVSSGNLWASLESGSADAVLALWSFEQTPDKLILSKPLLLTGPILVVSATSSITGLEGLKGKMLGYARGSTLVYDRAYPNAQPVAYDNVSKALTELSEGKIDALVMNALQAEVLIQGYYAGKLKVLGLPLTQEGIRLVAEQGERSAVLMTEFDRALDAFQKSGEYQVLLNKWGLIHVFY